MKKVLLWLQLIICLGLLVFVGVETQKLVVRSIAQQERKYDLANINHMKYSLFSVNSWKEKISNIVIQEVQNFKIDKSNKEALKKHLEAQLNVLIDKVNEQIQLSNQDSTMGWIKQQLMDMLVDIQDIKSGIPTYAEAIVTQVTAAQTQKEIKEVVKKKISKYLSSSYDKMEASELDPIIHRTHAKTLEEAREILQKEVPVENAYLWEQAKKIIILSVILFLIAIFHWGREIKPIYFFICWLLLVILLYAGVTSPMIDMEAKIEKFGFVLLGYNIDFTNLNVYYQSKSIIDVFFILISHAKPEMRVVGVLMILFSVVFPLLKLLASVVYYYNFLGSQNRAVIKMIVYQSGKWSMADVMVVAILMSYIGFNGMVTTQLGLMAGTFPKMTFISTNGTNLQFGFYIFLTYAIMSMFFSGISSRTRVGKNNDSD